MRFRSRAEAVRHYGLAPVAAPKGPSKSQPGHRSGADAAAFPRRPKPPRPEPYPKVSDRVPRAEAARRVAKAREKKTAPPEAPFHAAEGVKILSLGKVDARPGYHDANHVFPLGFKTEWVNSDKSAVFHSEIVDGVSGEGSAAAGAGSAAPPGPGPTFRVTRTLLSKTMVEKNPSDAAGSGAVGPVATDHARGDDDSRASVPLVVEARTSLDAWAKMIIASSGGWGGAESESDAPPHPTAPCGTGDRFALDDPEVIRALEADPFVDVSCGSYQYACQRGNRAEELARRAKYVASCSRELLRVAKEAAAGRARAAERPPPRVALTREARDAQEVRRVMDRLLARVEAAERHEAKRRERDLEREKLEAAKRLERAEKERRRLEEKAEREAARERERAEKEQRRLEEKAERDAAKERERAEKELKRAALAAQREKDREEREAAKEAAKAERERRREEEARNAERARVEGELAGRWLFGEPARLNDRDAPAVSIDPAFLPDARETRAALGAFADDPDPSVAGDALELWAFLDRFREVLFKEPPERDGDALEGRKNTRGIIRGGKKTRRGRRRKGGAARKKGAEHALPLVVQLGYDDCRLPREAYPPTPAALADALVSGEPSGGAAVVGALLTPLLASASKAQPSALLAKATALAPVGGDASAHALPGGAWEETLRRYLLGQAAAMETPPTEGLGSTLRAAAEAGELVCRWIVTGGPTALAAPPDASGGAQGGGGSAAAPTPAAAAATAALIEGFPRPAAALSARADAEALARCEIELYALAGDVFERDPSDPSDSSRKGGSTSTSAAAVRARRVEATRLARSACAMPEVRAVRQAVRVLAHEDHSRPPALSKRAAAEAGKEADAVPYYAAVAAGAGASAAARARHAKCVDYETIDARCAAGVYAVAELTVGAADALAADATRCGQLVKDAGAPDRACAHRVSKKIQAAAALRNGPKGEASKETGALIVDGRQYTLFGPEPAKLPKVAWDDGCAVCGGDVNAGVVLLCEECDSEYHCACLDPPLERVPEGEWRCPACVRGDQRDTNDEEEEDLRGVSADAPLAALEGTRLAAEAAGTNAGGSTRARAASARRCRDLAARLARRGGWAGLEPAERLETALELARQCLDCAMVRAALELGEKRAAEAREAMRRHVRDWESYRKYGVDSAEAKKAQDAARSAAEKAEEKAEAEEKATREAEERAKKAAAEAEGADDANGSREGDADDADDDDADDDEIERDGAADETDEAAKQQTAADGGKPGGTGPPPKSWRVRNAGSLAARAAVPLVAEAEGRVRWQARWHELEATLRRCEGRVDALGCDRSGAAHWLVAPWGLVASQPAGASAGVNAGDGFGGAGGRGEGHQGGGEGPAASASAKKRKAREGEEDGAIEAAASPGAFAPPAPGAPASPSKEAARAPAAGPDPAVPPPPAELRWGAREGADRARAFAAALDAKLEREGTLKSQIARRFGVDSVAPKEAEEGEDAKDEEEGEDASEASEASEPASEDEEEAAFLPPLRETTPVPPRPPDAWAPPGISAGEISASKKDSSPVVGAFASAFEAVRADLLATDARLPGVSDGGASLGGGADGRAMCLARGSKARRVAWRAFVARATTPAHLAMATALLELALEREWLSPAWLPWSPAAPALRAAETGERRHAKAALGAVAARLAALKRAVQWPKRAREEAAPAAEPQPKLTREERGSRRAAAAAAAAVAAAIAASEADMEVDAAKAAEREEDAGDDAEIDANVLSG